MTTPPASGQRGARDHPVTVEEAGVDRSELADRSASVVLITGMSGAGRTTAGRVLEDRGWYVVDNLPPTMLPELVRLTADDPHRQKIAAVVDVRTRDFTSELRRALTHLEEHGLRPRIVFVDSSDESLVRRFESVRRPHPLQGEGLLLDGIRRERRALSDLRTGADVVIDTSNYNVHQLTAKIDSLLNSDAEVQLRFAMVSFGFKYGIPLDADTVLDLRFLPNPYWIPELRDFTGRDAKIRDFVLSQDRAGSFIDHAEQMLRTAVSGYLSEGRRYVTVAVGCTGGKHRSVAVAEEMARRLSDLEEVGVHLTTFHRDLGRE